MPVRRVSSDSAATHAQSGDREPISRSALLAVPGLSGSCRQLDLSLATAAVTDAAVSSDDISPECVSPAVLLVPPPYPEASTAVDEISSTSKSDQGIQITVVEDSSGCPDDKPSPQQPLDSRCLQEGVVTPGQGQRVRIRLCDTRLDSGIGDDKHSQESQPSSSGACDEPEVIDSHQVIVQVQHSADLS